MVEEGSGGVEGGLSRKLAVLDALTVERLTHAVGQLRKAEEAARSEVNAVMEARAKLRGQRITLIALSAASAVFRVTF